MILDKKSCSVFPGRCSEGNNGHTMVTTGLVILGPLKKQTEIT